jgi:pyruvate,water dikinase
MPATLSDMASVMARALTPQGSEARTLSDRSYLLVADEYVNMNSRLAFHFALVDACLSDLATQNYISFRFAGGGATRARRSLRACFIERCLRHYGFRVERRGDLVNAWLKKTPAGETDAMLDILGRLMASTCQLDMYMTGHAAMEWYVQQFVAHNYSFRVEKQG